MGSGVKFTLNTKQAIREFKSYDKKTRNELTKAVALTARDVHKTQYSVLRGRVVKWTGQLANVIRIIRKRWNIAHIGPMGKVKYDWFIEDGSFPPPTGGNFSGYHYVEQSVIRNKKKFESRVKKAVDRNK